MDAATLLANRADVHLNLAEIDFQPSPLVLEQVSRLTRLHVQHLQHHTIYGSHPSWQWNTK